MFRCGLVIKKVICHIHHPPLFTSTYSHGEFNCMWREVFSRAWVVSKGFLNENIVHELGIINNANGIVGELLKGGTKEKMFKDESMKTSSTFWIKVTVKIQFFTHLLNQSPQNSYMPCEFWLTKKKQIVGNYVVFPPIYIYMSKMYLMIGLFL